MVNIKQITNVGFGTYRISLKSKENRDALKKALDFGCNLIDTASNYGNGESEKLIGDILKENTKTKVFIVTKAGYISGDNLNQFKNLKINKNKKEFLEISNNLIHSIAPEYLEHQIAISLNRLNRQCIDGFLLHSPEYHFQKNPMKNDEYYSKIERAFTFLEEKVRQKKIRYYGISSNVFNVDPLKKNSTDLNKVLEISKKISSTSHFKFIQFPYNLLECEAAIASKNNTNSLIDIAKSENLSIISNRALNANSKNGLLRLVYYQLNKKDNNYSKNKALLDSCLKYIENVLKDNYEDTTLDDFDVCIFLKKRWNKIESAEMFGVVFNDMLYPFLTTIYQGNIPGKVLLHFKRLERVSWNYYLKFLSVKTAKYFNEHNLSYLLKDLKEPLPNILIRKYLGEGIDHVLCGMTKTKYVDELKEFFNNKEI